jgi:chromosome transmission fidelity protein 4
LVTGSTDKLTSHLVTQLHPGLGNDTTGTNVPIKVDYLISMGTHIIISSGSKVVLFKAAGLKQSRTLSQRQGTIRSLAIEMNGVVAIGSDETDIHLVNIFKPDWSESLVGHKNAVRSLSFNQKGNILLSASADGSVKVWSVPGNCIRTIGDLIPTCIAEDRNYYPVRHSPTDSIYAVSGSFGDVVIMSAEHKKIKSMKNDEVIQNMEFSPNGLYLACLGIDGSFAIWNVEKECKVLEYKHQIPITGLSWAMEGNAIYLGDVGGEVWHCNDVITNGPSPTSKSLPVDDKVLFGNEDSDNDMNDMNPFMDLHANEEMGDDFVVDDDGAGYLEDIKSEKGYQEYRKRSKRESLAAMDKMVEKKYLEDDDMMSESLERNKFEETALQTAFQPGSVSQKGNRHYLTLNLTGTICVIENGETYTVDVDYHDATKRPFHFTDSTKYSMGALNQSGCVLASTATTSDPSMVYFRQMDSWTSRNEWTVALPEGETAMSVGVCTQGILVATDYHYLRIFSPSGMQTYLRSIPGPVVTMSAHESVVFVVYHVAGSFHKNASMAYQLIDLSTFKTIKTDLICLSPMTSLEWVGFTKSGVPLTYDTVGVLRGLFVNTDGLWAPLFDSRLFRKTSSDWYFPVGANDKQLYCVVCRGEKIPSFPKPIIIDIPMSIPFCSLDSDRSLKEQQLFHHRLFLNEYKNNRDQVVEETARRELEMDKIILPLLLAACKGQLSQRALELAFDLTNLKSLDGAIRVASNNHLQALTERLMTLKEVRLRELEEDDAPNPYYLGMSMESQSHSEPRVEYAHSKTQDYEVAEPKRRKNPIAVLQDDDEGYSHVAEKRVEKNVDRRK